MSGKALNVLLIEGDENETSLVKRYLGDAAGSSDRFEVQEAVRVSTACHALAREEFDVVILDLQVPQNVGLEGFHRIRAQRPEAPIVLLTALQDEELARQGVRRGAQDYLVKGTVDCCLLKRALRGAIEKKKLSNLVERLLDMDAAARLVVDGEALVLHANPAAEALFGVSAKELVGKPFAFPRESGAVTIVSPQASELSAEMTVSGVEWNGEPARLISFMSAPGAEAPRKEGRAPEERRRLDGIKSQFTRKLSHEMRNTMSTIKTAVFCLKDPLTGPLSPRQARLADMISRNADRQIRVFDALGDLARFEGGKLKLDLRPVELPALINEIARESEFKGAPKRLVVAPMGVLPVVEGDPDLLLQLLRGLLDNAFRHAESTIELKASPEAGGGVRVTVADDGEGIAPERLADLFTPFDQLDKRVDAPGLKAGLGLTISRAIVEGHGGRIWAENGEAGSRFIFTLPSAAERQSAPDKRIFVSHSRSRPIYAASGAVAKDRP
jgi:signal transduction histidine kinase/CheY-like chemotaxis protein